MRYKAIKEMSMEEKIDDLWLMIFWIFVLVPTFTLIFHLNKLF